MRKEQDKMSVRPLSEIVSAENSVWKRQAAADQVLAQAFSTARIDTDLLKTALQEGAHPDRPVCDGYPPLHVALLRDELLAASFLLAAGADANSGDADGATALELAARHGKRDAVLLLREYFNETGISPAEDRIIDVSSYQQDVDAALVSAVKMNLVDRARAALALGADPDAPMLSRLEGYAPLHYAAARCNKVMAEILLQAGADISLKSSHGETVADMLWHAHPEKLFTPEWTAFYQRLQGGGQASLLSKLELRQVMPVKGFENTSLVHFMVKQGHVDKVMEILKTYPAQHLTVKDFLVRSPDVGAAPETLLTVFARAGALDRAFSTDVWQGRLDEMLELQKHAENNALCLRSKVDFAAAATAVLKYQQNELRQMARNRGPRLKRGEAP